jgi:hypothetical protein
MFQLSLAIAREIINAKYFIFMQEQPLSTVHNKLQFRTAETLTL